MDVGPGRGGQYGHGEAGVDVFQVASHRRLTGIQHCYFTSYNTRLASDLQFGVEGIEKVIDSSRHPGILDSDSFLKKTSSFV